jgi:hypothetical protein
LTCLSELTTFKNKDGDQKKDFKLPVGWNKLKETSINTLHDGIGRITGKVNEITVFDFDNRATFRKFFEDHKNLYLFDYYMVQSLNGYHLYFQYDESCKTGTNVMKNYEGIDIRNDGGFITIPPTKYKCLDGSTFEYEVVNDVPLLPVPQEFKDALEKQKQPKKTKAITKPIENIDEYDMIKELLPLL